MQIIIALSIIMAMVACQQETSSSTTMQSGKASGARENSDQESNNGKGSHKKTITTSEGDAIDITGSYLTCTETENGSDVTIKSSCAVRLKTDQLYTGILESITNIAAFNGTDAIEILNSDLDLQNSNARFSITSYEKPTRIVASIGFGDGIIKDLTGSGLSSGNDYYLFITRPAIVADLSAASVNCMGEYSSMGQDAAGMEVLVNSNGESIQEKLKDKRIYNLKDELLFQGIRADSPVSDLIMPGNKIVDVELNQPGVDETVWTGFDPDGSAGPNCLNWLTQSDIQLVSIARISLLLNTDWIATMPMSNCSVINRSYCLIKK